MTKHTPEPWEAFDAEITTPDKRVFVAVTDESIHMTQNEQRANAARIVACVNACAGMEDPAGEIERLQAISLRHLRDLDKWDQERERVAAVIDAAKEYKIVRERGDSYVHVEAWHNLRTALAALEVRG